MADPLPEGLSGLSPAAREMLARRAREGAPPTAVGAPIPHRAAASEAPLSSRQQQVWFFERLEPGSAAYHLPKEVRLRGPLEVAALERALGEVVRRHEILRTCYEMGTDGALSQRVVPGHGLALPKVDVAASERRSAGVGDSDVAQTAAWREEARSDALRPFDLAAGEVVRAKLFRFAAGDHLLHLVFHHIAFDGWSTGVFLRDLAAAYRGALRGDPTLPPLPIQYGDYAAWEAERLESGRLARELDYWRLRLHGAPPESTLPPTRPRRAHRTYAAAQEERRLPERLVSGLRELGRQQGATDSAVLLAAFQVLLSRHSGARDLVVGVPIAGRTRSEQEDLVGYFVNMLPVRSELSGDPSFRQVVDRVRSGLLEAFAHQAVPFDRVVADLRLTRAAGITPVFQIAFNDRILPHPPAEFEGLDVEARAGFHGRSLLDLSLDVTRAHGGLECVLTYSLELFDPGYVRRLLTQLETLLEGLVADPDGAIAAASLLRPEERARLIEAGRGPRRPLSPESRIHTLVEAQAAREPGATAVIGEGEVLSRDDLNHRADQLAARLRAVGLAPESRVGVFVERSPGQIVALLGILKAGGAYVPLDPDYPSERLAFIAHDSGMEAIVTTRRLRSRLPLQSIPALCLDDPGTHDAPRTSPSGAAGPAPPDPLAYIIYTSGSTGTPKGVEVTHGSVVNLVRAGRDLYQVGPADRGLQFSSINFDASVAEIFTPLAAGAAVVVCTPAMLASVPRFLRACEERGVTLLRVNTAFWHEMVVSMEEDGLEIPSAVRAMIIGGEAARPDRLALWRRHGRGASLFNVYGPTETTVWATVQELTRPTSGEGHVVPIGHPMANVDVHVLDERLDVVPPGVAGELYIGGSCVARGYHDRPELTAERFIPDPFSAVRGARLFRTGDIVRRREDGALDFLGRADDQVKIRGFRIEPGEVVAALGSHPSVRHAVVIPRRDGAGDLRLVAYVVPARGAFHPDVLGAHLRRSLPEHMIPAAFVRLAELPLLPNGKVDRRSLPDPDPVGATPHEPPRNPLETTLCEIWEGVLGVRPIGRNVDFFEAGGHSLAAMRVAGRAEAALGMEVPLRAIFEHATVAGLAAFLEPGRQSTGFTFPPVDPRSDSLAPLSFGQRRLWFLDRLDPGRATYNIPWAFRIDGPLDAPALSDALRRIVQRHEPLRTRIREGADGPVQVTTRADAFELVVEDIASGPEDPRATVMRRLEEEARRPFDLGKEIPFRARLFRHGAGEHALFLCIHHIAADGESGNILFEELETLYGAAVTGAEPSLRDVPVSYGAYATWQRRHEVLLRPGLERWSKRLHGARALELPTDRPRAGTRGKAGGQCRARLPDHLLEELRQLAERERCTLHMALLATFQVLLSRLTGQDDIVVGTPMAGRPRPELEPLIGLFANTVPIRVDFAGELSFADALGRVRAAMLAIYGDEAVPLEAMVEASGVERDGSANPLTQVAFALDPDGRRVPRLHGLVVERIALHTGTSKFDLFLASSPAADGLELRLEYDGDLFQPRTAAHFLELFLTLVSAALADPHRPVADLDLCSDEERRWALDWNRTGRPLPEGTVHELFAAAAARTPDAVAVEDTRERLTYADLDARSGALARRLLASGLEPGERVGVCMERGAPLVVALLGILKAGGCYVPLDPMLPQQRLELLIEDAAIARVIAATPALPGLRGTGVEVVELGADPERADEAPPATFVAGAADDLAYVIYTSGSTGRPKGVAVPHRAIVRLVLGSDYVELRADDVVAQASTPSFDAATFEIWGALLNGARLTIPGPRLHSPRELERFLHERGITTLFLTTALFNQVTRERPAAFGSLRHLLFGGETADAEAARRVLESGSPPERLLHVYGPTENTTFSTWYAVRGVPPGATTLPIGRPIANSTAWVLDSRGKPQPRGLWGDLHVGGAGVAAGYLGAATAGADRFIPDPFADSPGRRLYRTGDRARWNLDGELEFGGRLDTQVKLRGFRIELGEVEGALRRCEDVRDAAVVLQGEGPGRHLVAYVAGPDDLDRTRLQDQLRQHLPAYMVPSVLFTLNALPLTASGKVDRQALTTTGTERASGARPLGDPLRRQIADIWTALLGVEAVGARDSFFDLGGHSLLALEMIRRVEAATGRHLELRVLFEEPTVAHLARVLASQELETASPVVRVREGDTRIAPFFLFHGDFNGAGLYSRGLVAEFDESQPVYIVHPHQPGGPETIEEMADDLLREVRRVRPHGPYRLGGHCNGGVVAFEAAQRLVAAGETVELLVLVDAPGRNVGLARYAAFLDRVSRMVHLPSQRRRALFHATRRSAQRLVSGWIGAGATAGPHLAGVRRAAVLATWVVGESRRVAARLIHTVGRLRGSADPTPPRPHNEHLARADYFARAMRGYVPEHFRGELVVVAAEADETVSSSTSPRLWARVADRAEVYSMSGDHLESAHGRQSASGPPARPPAAPGRIPQAGPNRLMNPPLLPAGTPPVGPGEVHVWRARCGPDPTLEATLPPLLSQDERDRADRFRREADGLRFRIAHGLLRVILGRYAGLEPDTIRFRTGPHGKPRLAPGSAKRSVEFNLSHSGDAVLVAVALDARVGVDVERLDRAPDAEGIARRFFAAPELARILATTPPGRARLFLRHWVMKEAFVKGVGLGLGAGDLRSFAVDPDATNGPGLLALTSEMHQRTNGWAVVEIPAPTAHVAAVALESPVVRVTTFDWPGPA